MCVCVCVCVCNVVALVREVPVCIYVLCARVRACARVFVSVYLSICLSVYLSDVLASLLAYACTYKGIIGYILCVRARACAHICWCVWGWVVYVCIDMYIHTKPLNPKS